MSDGFASSGSQEFSDEEKLDRTRQKSKKGGPYSKKERFERQKKIHKLHLEYGYSATKIAQMLNVNRHTVAKDIKMGYESLYKEMINYDHNKMFVRQIHRYEARKIGLIEAIEKATTHKEKMDYEKMIFSIEREITNIYLKFNTSAHVFENALASRLNDYAKRHDLNMLFTRSQDMRRTSRETGLKIVDLIRKDKASREIY